MKNGFALGTTSLLLVLSHATASASDARDFEPMSRFDYVSLQHMAARVAPAGDRAAFVALQRLACAGEKRSQAALGSLYLQGHGTPGDALRGYVWIKLAAEYPFPAFRSTVKAIEGQWTPQQRAYAQSEAETLRALYGLRATNMTCSATPASSFASNVKNSFVCVPAKQSSSLLVRRCVGDEAAAIAPLP